MKHLLGKRADNSKEFNTMCGLVVSESEITTNENEISCPECEHIVEELYQAMEEEAYAMMAKEEQRYWERQMEEEMWEQEIRRRHGGN